MINEPVSHKSRKREIKTSSIEPVAQDMFQVYSTEGLLAHELDAFGITRTTCTPGFATKRKDRMSRVSTEVHPDLLFAEFLWDD